MFFLNLFICGISRGSKSIADDYLNTAVNHLARVSRLILKNRANTTDSFKRTEAHKSVVHHTFSLHYNFYFYNIQLAVNYPNIFLNGIY